ncbi:hypothetical protein CXB38_03830 [Pseudomonas syringae]|uniref:hypothetical protein n=1 Tax=Pseudomonas syringae TaxID=317 RepID=UPI000CDB2669|nr:hypothetical protein [Pseudomonas syringae]POP84418.1 hypothetical protein CXB38_03830 [Pseudomonas syringae]
MACGLRIVTADGESLVMAGWSMAEGADGVFAFKGIHRIALPIMKGYGLDITAEKLAEIRRQYEAIENL